MNANIRTSGARFELVIGFAFCTLFTGIASGQSAEDGIPVTDPVVIAKCGTCHARDERGNMQRVSWSRATPEGWQSAIKSMILGKGVSLTASEARAIDKTPSTCWRSLNSAST